MRGTNDIPAITRQKLVRLPVERIADMHAVISVRIQLVAAADDKATLTPLCEVELAAAGIRDLVKVSNFDLDVSAIGRHVEGSPAASRACRLATITARMIAGTPSAAA